MVDFNFQPKDEKSDYGWYGRGYIPHFDGGQVTQFLTLRLRDSMPQNVLKMWKETSATDAEFRKKVEVYLDSGYGECWLKNEKIAELVQNSFLFHDKNKYRLISWVVMPNHAHMLLTPLENEHLPEILHSIKSYTAQKSNKLLGRAGQFWQYEAFDRYIRNNKHFDNTIRYIENNQSKQAFAIGRKIGVLEARILRNKILVNEFLCLLRRQCKQGDACGPIGAATKCCVVVFSSELKRVRKYN
jgi:REP element-mobilizing transposase RayT